MYDLRRLEGTPFRGPGPARAAAPNDRMQSTFGTERRFYCTLNAGVAAPVLGATVAPIGRLSVPSNRNRIVLRDAVAKLVRHPQTVLSGGITPLSEGPPKFDGSRKVAASGRGPTFFNPVPVR
jgi:hypothetical protein